MAASPLVEAVSVVLRRGDCLLLVKRGRAPALGMYAFPGGRVEAGESLPDAARRELLEETGLTAGPLTPLRLFHLPDDEGTPRFALTVFLAESAEGSLVPSDDAAEAGFFTLAELRSLPAPPSVREVAEELLGAPTPS